MKNNLSVCSRRKWKSMITMMFVTVCKERGHRVSRRIEQVDNTVVYSSRYEHCQSSRSKRHKTVRRTSGDQSCTLASSSFGREELGVSWFGLGSINESIMGGCSVSFTASSSTAGSATTDGNSSPLTTANSSSVATPFLSGLADWRANGEGSTCRASFRRLVDRGEM